MDEGSIERIHNDVKSIRTKNENDLTIFLFVKVYLTWLSCQVSKIDKGRFFFFRDSLHNCTYLFFPKSFKGDVEGKRCHVQDTRVFRGKWTSVIETVKWNVLLDKWKRSVSVMFEIRVDVWHRLNNLTEDREKRTGLGFSRSERLTQTRWLCKYVWSDASTTEHQFHTTHPSDSSSTTLEHGVCSREIDFAGVVVPSSVTTMVTLGKVLTP